MPNPDCLSDAALRAFLLGEASERAARIVSVHLERCSDCQAAAASLDGITDPAIRALRRALSPERGPNGMPSGKRQTGAAFDETVPGPLANPPIPVGDAFGRFRIIRELGRGGFGVVYLANDPVLRRSVALKVPHAHTLADAEFRKRFLGEARAAASLDHPCVVRVYEAGEMEHTCYIASAYCPGVNLAQWLKRQAEPAPLRQAAALLARVADAVAHAHSRGIVHRDLKPANILLEAPQPAGSEGAVANLSWEPRLTDFGLARLLEAEVDQTTTGVVMGTPPYMAPEQAEGWSDRAGAATDVYALGVILYELLTGRLPFRGASVVQTLDLIRAGDAAGGLVPPSRLRPELPRDLETVCLKCLRLEPTERYASAAALADDLRRHLHGEPIQARRPALPDRLWRWCRRPERIRDAAVVAAFYSLVMIGVSGCGVLLILSGLLLVDRPLPAAGFLSGFVVVGSTLSWLAWRIARRDVVALWACLVLPILVGMIQITADFGGIQTGGLIDFSRDVSTSAAQLLTLLFLAAGQAGCNVLALMAYYANRHRPLFLPARRDGTNAGNA